ncbi:MAG: TspO/MBR family protein [Steroidobacteraceae bacterium]
MNNPSISRQLIGLAGWLLVSFAAGAIGAIASVEARTFYGQLTRPDWAPPGWLFGPVWSALFALMGLAAWLVWRQHGFKAGRAALVLFVIQLAANALWSWLFFAWHQGGLAFAEVLVLWALIVATSVSFWRHSALAGAMMLPYLAWVTFASALTYSTWQLNPGLL